ncbi:hypothetical protein [Pontibaca salina]|uniref:Tryptophan-rich sensory protein n=1 Tax=Pontibaca salina TaxID=2795731 RepID=A0A934HN25_9RHOB|nr:hypothetical protein [Pontibaca salina]MBI6628387.1 hypothetical protein [Pontibaca salina]
MATDRPTPLMAVLAFLATLAFVASPLVVPGFGGFDPYLFTVPQVNAAVQPAGWAFSIWGLIYLWLLVSAAAGLFLRAREVDWEPMRAPLTLSLAVGATWLPIAKISPVAASVLIWVMLAAALPALSRAPVLDRWLARGPVALYSGWLTAAACVSLGLLLAGYGLLDNIPAAIVALLLAMVLGSIVLWQLRDIAEYGIGIIWALFGVIGHAWDQYPAVVALSGLGIIVISALSLRSGLRREGPHPQVS